MNQQFNRIYRLFIGLTAMMIALAASSTRRVRIRVHPPEMSELGQTHVSNMIQDSVGFVWFATWNGLVRYDGYNLMAFKPILCSNGTIDSNRIYNVKLSRSSTMWCVSSDNRLFQFDPLTCTFSNLSALIPQISAKKVKVLTPLKNGFTWVTFSDGSTLRLDDHSPLLSPLFFPSPGHFFNGATKINGIDLSQQGHEWVFTDRVAVNYTAKSVVEGSYNFAESHEGMTYLFGSDGEIVNAGDRRIRSKIDGTVRSNQRVGRFVMLGTDRGIFSFNLLSGEILQYTALPIDNLFKDSRRRVWGFSGDNRVVLIENPAQAVSALLETPRAEGVTDGKSTRSIAFESADGSVILRTPNGVISTYDETDKKLTEILVKDRLTATTSRYQPAEVKKVLVDSARNLWVVGSDGVDCLRFTMVCFENISTRDGETRALAFDNQDSLWIGTKDGTVSCGAYSLTTGPAYVIKRSPSGEMWIGTKGNGLWVVTRQGNTFDVKHLRHPEIPSDTIYDVAFDGHNRVWLGSYGRGLAVGNLSGGKRSFQYVAGQPPDMKIRKILPLGDGNLLIGTADGLVSARNVLSSNPQYFLNKFRPEEWGLKGNDIMGLACCDGRYYAAVFGNGLSRIDSRNLFTDTLHFTHYPLSSSADADQIRTCISSGSRIVIFSGSSLTCFNTGNGTMNVFGADDFNDVVRFTESFPAVKGDTIVAGTTDGYLVFSTGSLRKQSTLRHVAVTGIMYQNDIAVKPLNNPGKITINPRQRSFTILISDFDYSGSDSRPLRYRLEGHDPGWNYLRGPRLSLSYNNLQPGEYDLVFEVEESDGRWVPVGRKIVIDVVARFVETAVFKGLIIILIAGVFVALTFLVIYFRRMRNDVQRRYSLLMMVDRISDNDKLPAPEKESPDREAEQFIQSFLDFLNENIENPDLVIEDFARHIGMSRTGFYNRMKETTGCSPVAFLRQMRIKRSLAYLAAGSMSISEVAYKVGYADPKYFSRCFKAEMGMTPTQYLASISQQPSPPPSPGD